MVASAMLTGPHNLVVPGRADHDALVLLLAQAAWQWGQAHAQQDLEAAHRRASVFNDGPPTPQGPMPYEAIRWAQARVALQGKWQRDLDALVTQAIVTGLEQGLTNADVMAHLGKVFPEFGKPRLENIARTESVAAYNQGRMSVYKDDRLVVAVQFAAILDNRTSNICRERDGLIMRLDDERMAENTPPLHYQCRSVLVPLTRYDWEDLQAGDASAKERFFGWLPDGGPKSLNDALAWDVPAPLPGFGTLKS